MATLSNGVDFPRIHFGTYQLAGQQCYDAVKHALAVGYTAIDTATIYKNETIVAKAIADSGKQPFLTTKINPSEMGYDNTLVAFDESLKRLGRTSVDLLLIHWPGKARLPPNSEEHRKARIETWRAFEKIYYDKKARSIGVSNFEISHLKQLQEDGAKISPMVNQFEIHIQLQRRELVKFCRDHNILVQCYSPLGSGGAPVLERTKISSRFALQMAMKLSDAVLVKSATPQRIEDNLIDLVEANKVETQPLEKFEANTHYCWNPKIVS